MKKSCTIISSCESKRGTYKFSKSFENKSVRLAKSIRKNGGRLSDVPILMWYGEDAPPSKETQKKLIDFGCKLVQEKCEYTKDPLFAKVSACKIPIDTDFGVWMDSDIFVLDDLYPLLDGDFDVSASPTDFVHHKWANTDDEDRWRQLYRINNVEMPNRKLKTYIDGLEGLFYLCSGLFIFKNGIGFPDLYYSTCKMILDNKNKVDSLNFTQTGLSIAVVKGDFKYKYIPEHMHYVYATHGHKLGDNVAAVHYQDAKVQEITDSEWDV